MTTPAVVKRPAFLLVPLGAGALVSLGLGVLGRTHEPTYGSIFGARTFSETIWIKYELTLVVLTLALVQLLTALWMYGKLGVRAPSWAGTLHRITGLLAVLTSVPVAYQCLWYAGFATTNTRVLAHSLFGCVFYGAFVAKVLTLHSRKVPGWALPWVAGLLFAALVGVGVTGAIGYYEFQSANSGGGY